MSKAKKVLMKKSSDPQSNHLVTLSFINTQSPIPNYSQITDKQEPYSESPYAQKLTKARSTSVLKNTTFYHASGQVSPPLNPKFNLNLKNKINISTSLAKIKDLNESHVKIKKKTVLADRKIIENQIHLIEIKAEEIITQHKENGISNELMDKYREILDEIIAKDKNFGVLIGKIKLAYEDWINLNSISVSENNKLKEDIQEYMRKLTEKTEEIKLFHKKIQKLSRENVELGRALEQKDNDFRVLQEHLLKITNINIDEIPTDKSSWKVLIVENKACAELCKKLKEKNKSLKSQEKMLMNLLWILKQKGYPVEEIYENMGVKENNDSKLVSEDELSEDMSYSIESDVKKNKVDGIPMLKISQIKANSFSDESLEESF
ncbi:hypothetical protein SteCoe_13483 [Stentor coeruleus]|uniref:Translin-associated factor X-interacting protein 1 N-terminal domain-containing protein n=1 Tax=Stentor coeruleus TaxID=5963 RepID=A0A1R2C8B0_9CILI|nr:hypothetical protein SteCoe_13483 [Stentor coeruleus]